VAHDFADPQLTLRAAGGGILFVMTGHVVLRKHVRHGRASPGHDVFSGADSLKDVDARHKAGHDVKLLQISF